MNSQRPRSIHLFSLLFWASLVISIAADIYFWDRTMFEMIGDEVAEADVESWMHWSLAAALAATYTIQALLWLFVAEKRSRIAQWLYVLLVGLFAFGMVIGFDSYAMDELATYGVVTMLLVASACFLFTPEAQQWFAGKTTIDPAVFE